MNESEHTGFIIRQKMPANLEYSFSALDTWLIPNDDFYVRSHFRTPPLDKESYRLVVDGHVDHPLELTLDEIQQLPAVKRALTLECAGNGRIYYEPAREGVQWQMGAVGNAAWGGVLLRTVLEEASIQPGAVEVVLQGADRGTLDLGKKTSTPGDIAFARSLPLRKALSDEVVLAYTMNDDVLPQAHGYPLRAVVGGWYGMASVKWLTHIQVIDRPYMGYWQTKDYVRWVRDLGEPTQVPLSELAVKSQIAQPTDRSILSAGTPVRVFGAAWSGEAAVVKVEVSTDGGDTWQQANLLEPDEPHAWRFFEYTWTPPAAGQYTLLSRATDAQGNTQPLTQQPDRESYMVNWSIPIEVRVR